MNANGSLSDLLTSSAGALGGHGKTVNDTLKGLSEAASTLKDASPDLFATIRNLQAFITALAANDRQIVGFSDQFSSISGLLNSNRTEIDALLNSLATEMGQIKEFVGSNHDKLVSDVSALQNITQLLVNREDDLAQILHAGPTALDDFYNIYDPQSKSLTGAVALPDLPDAKSLFCVLATTVNAPQDMCATAAKSLTDQLVAALVGKATTPPVLGDLSSILVPTAGGSR
jgi:phospholipid/cholesterol/gamma-HCH transport system substrate-binding protein